MLSAIIAAIIALIVVVAILVVLYVVLRGRKTENVSVKRDVRSIQSVGVKSSLPDSHRVPAGGVARGASPAALLCISIPLPLPVRVRRVREPARRAVRNAQ